MTDPYSVATGTSTTMGIAIAFGLSMGANTAFDIFKLVHDKNAKDRLADGVALVFDVGGAAFGAYKLGQLPKLPSNAPGGTVYPTNKGQLGEYFSEMIGYLRGERIVAKQVTIKPATGKPTKVDLVFRNMLTGKLRFVESKNGPKANLMPNQKAGYPVIGSQGGEIRTDKLAAFGLPKGTKIGPTPVVVEWWNKD
jgi:hypothetical protein